MAKITDKTVKSKYPPKQTNVTWIDTSQKPAVTKSYIDGQWVAVSGGGGTKKYSDLDNKPSINGVELDGNKTSQDIGVYSKPSSGIPQSDLSSDVQSQLNKHFKGWYASANALPSNPIVGDYAYVKGAESTDPATIYECTTNGSWSDSGRTADTSNVQTFASNQEVNEVYIVNDLTTGGSEDVLSAEQGKELDNKKFDKEVDDDTFYITDSNGYIIFKIDAFGIHTTNLVLNSSELSFTDGNGNIVLKIDENGIIHTTKDKHAVACMVLSESYYPTTTPIRDSSGNITQANVMFETGVSGTLNITYTNGNATSVIASYGNYNYIITINRDSNGNVTTVNVTETE